MSTIDNVFPVFNYEQVEEEMNRMVEKEFYEGAFFKNLLQGSYTLPQIRHFAIQYSYYSRNFPRVLGAAISAMAPIDDWWIPLADNLWDEAGRGVLGKSHEQLYRSFLLSVDPEISLDENENPPEPMSPAVETAIRTFIEFFYHATPLEAMAAVGLGSEMFAGNVMGTIAKGLQHPVYNAQRKLNVLFWTLHAEEHEPHHYQLCKDILIGHTDVKSLRTMLEVGRSIAISEARMYEGLHQEMTRITDR